MIALSTEEKDRLVRILEDSWGYASDAGDFSLANRISAFQLRIVTGKKLEPQELT